MKKTVKILVCLVLIAALCVSFAGCAKINYVTNGTIQAIQEVKSGEWQNTETAEEAETSDEDVAVIDELVPGEYGGINFQTIDDVVNYYVEAYDYTKSLTAEYIQDDGSTAVFYKLLGDEDLSAENILVEGKSNSTINSIVPGIVNGLFSANVYGLVPCNNRNPELDNNNDDAAATEKYDFRTSYLTPEDVLAANVKDNGDGTITLEIQPKAASMSQRGADSQGRMFEALGDIASTVDSISVLSWASGSTDENVVVDYKGGTAVVTIDTASKEIVEADYTMNVKVGVQHANVTIIKDKSASLDIIYKNHYPASDDYLKKSKGLSRK